MHFPRFFLVFSGKDGYNGSTARYELPAELSMRSNGGMNHGPDDFPSLSEYRPFPDAAD